MSDAAKLQPHRFYQQKMDELRKENRYARAWTLRIVKKTNKHPETAGGPWGWYEVWPLSIEVGLWGPVHDDLANVDIGEWNRIAAGGSNE